MKDFHTRRLFMQRSMAMLAAVPTVPLFLDSTAHAMTALLDDGFKLDQNSGSDGKILVIVQLSGGNDGLNMVIPFGDDAYYKARPSLGKNPNEVLKLDNYLGLHPNLSPLKSLFDDGSMTILQGVGYPNANRSHFRSMDIWHSAQPDKEYATSGWLGRYFDACCSGTDPKAEPTPVGKDGMMGVSIGEVQPLSMRGERVMPVNFESAGAFRYRGSDRDGFARLNDTSLGVPVSPEDAPTGWRDVRRNRLGNPTEGEQIDFISRTALDALANSDRIAEVTRNFQPTMEYPRGEFGEGLRTVAAMIAGELPTRVYYVSLGGFDTHANQAGRHDQLMAVLAQGINAFWQDMMAQKNDQRVMLMTFSEFGRRVSQNGSGGTDHGAAAPVMLFGSRVKQGVLGKHPSLTDLDAGDLKFSIDFRNIYASLLENWLDVPSKPILGRQFETARLVKG